MWHDVLWYILLLALLLFGLFINIYTLPGLWLMAASYGIYGWITGWHRLVGWKSFGTLVVLALIGEIIELAVGNAGTKAAGASKRASIGMIVGAILGGIFLTVPFPIVGTIIGVCLGAAIGAGVVELAVRRDIEQSLRVGVGAFKGRFMGVISKVVIGLIMFLIALVVGFPY
jgi:uncharacterized protein